MANINFGLLDTQYPEKLANAFVRSPEQQNANMLQVMQMQQLMDQREQAQYALGKSRREETGLLEFGNAIKALGPDPSPLAIAQVFMQHPNENMKLKGFELQKQARANQGYRDLGPMGVPAVAPTPAPAPGSFGENMLANRAGLPFFGDKPPAVTVAAPVAPTATRESLIAQLETRLRTIDPFVDGSTQAKSEAERLTKQIENLRKAQNVGAGGTLITAGLSDFTAPQLPQQPRQVNLATDLLIPGPNGTMVPNQALIKIKEGLRPHGTTVTVKTEQAYGGAVAAGAAKQDLAQIDRAQNLPQDFAKIDETLNILKNTDINTGLGADLFTVLDKARQQVTADKKAGKRAVNTEYLDSLLGSAVFPQIQALGIGARGMDTPAEREFLRKVMTGTVSLTKDTLIKMTELRRKGLETESELFNKRVEKGEFKPYEEAARRKVQAITVPPMEVIFAVNPQTKARIQSTDGGQTWTPVGGT